MVATAVMVFLVGMTPSPLRLLVALARNVAAAGDATIWERPPIAPSDRLRCFEALARGEEWWPQDRDDGKSL